MEVRMLEAKRLGHRAVLRLSWLLLVASVALSTLLQVAVAPPTRVGYLTAGATSVWLLGSFAVLSLLYRAEVSADQAVAADKGSAEWPPASPGPAPSQRPCATARRRSADQARPGRARPGRAQRHRRSGQLAAAAGLSASYARALVAQFHARPPAPTAMGGRPPRRPSSRRTRRHHEPLPRRPRTAAAAPHQAPVHSGTAPAVLSPPVVARSRPRSRSPAHRCLGRPGRCLAGRCRGRMRKAPAGHLERAGHPTRRRRRARLAARRCPGCRSGCRCR